MRCWLGVQRRALGRRGFLPKDEVGVSIRGSSCLTCAQHGKTYLCTCTVCCVGAFWRATMGVARSSCLVLVSEAALHAFCFTHTCEAQCFTHACVGGALCARAQLDGSWSGALIVQVCARAHVIICLRKRALDHHTSHWQKPS